LDAVTHTIPEGTVMFHGTRGSFDWRFDKPLWVTGDWDVAEKFARMQVGEGAPYVIEFVTLRDIELPLVHSDEEIAELADIDDWEDFVEEHPSSYLAEVFCWNTGADGWHWPNYYGPGSDDTLLCRREGAVAEFKQSLMPPSRRKNDALADARARLLEGEIVTYVGLTTRQAYADRAVRRAIESEDSRTFAAAKLAEDAGFVVGVRVQEWDNGDIYTIWQVSVPPDVERSIAALVWDGKEGDMEYTLTRSTRHPGWQLTSWARDGGPWGHVDIEGPIGDAFDTDPMASGVSLSGLLQVVFRDGTILVRRGAQPIALNPSFMGISP
jgi:hypothetical protein